VAPSIRVGKQRLVYAVSLVTALWLVVQLAAGLTLHETTWPVAAYPMFDDNPRTIVEFRLLATTRSGQHETIRPQGLGLIADSLRFYLTSQVVAPSGDGAVRPEGARGLARLVRSWNARRPSNPAVVVRLIRDVVPLPTGKRGSLVLLTWGRG
jgi:hypothetical protein